MVYELKIVVFQPGVLCISICPNVHLEVPEHKEHLYANLAARLKRAIPQGIALQGDPLKTVVKDDPRREGYLRIEQAVTHELLDGPAMAAIEQRFRSEIITSGGIGYLA